MQDLQKGVCPHCDAPMVQYRFGFNQSLRRFLIKLYQAGGDPVEISTLGLTNPEYTNYQKPRYWGLIEQYLTEDTDQKRGWWFITQKGKDFVEGKIWIQRYVVMYRNRFVRFEGESIKIDSPLPRYQHRRHYMDQKKAQMNGSGQFEFPEDR